jgi:radical SAM protein with 4Fe4S-binding SPASM domain
MISANEIKREEFISQMVEKWLGNPLTRSALKIICNEGKSGNRLEAALKMYSGHRVNCGLSDAFVSVIVKLLMDMGGGLLGIPNQKLKDAMRDPVIRRAITNIFTGIAEFGVQKPFTSSAPFLVVWNYTKICNLRCKHCYADAGVEQMEGELSTEEAKRAIDEFERAGVVAIAFSGGEPLMRKDIFEVASYAKKKHFYVSVATNGTLITDEMAKKMKDTFDYVEVSLDGFESTHDQFRGVKGAWKLTCAGIKNCVANGIDTCVALTATRQNLNEIPELIDFIEDELGAGRVIIFNYIPVGRGKEIVDLDLSPEERRGLLKYLYSRMMENDCKTIFYSTAPQYSTISWEYAHGPTFPTHFMTREAIRVLQDKTKTLAEFLGGCGSGRLYCAMEPNGDITPCVFIPIKIGNIKDQGLKEIWRHSKVLERLRDRKSFESCSKCKYNTICGGCRARAFGYFGDLQAPDPGCIHNMRYWEELKGALGESALTGEPQLAGSAD